MLVPQVFKRHFEWWVCDGIEGVRSLPFCAPNRGFLSRNAVLNTLHVVTPSK
jgi:hypothetical protein